MGWSGHEWGWRGAAAFAEIYERVDLIERFYQDPMPEWAAMLGADYVVFGSLERERFGELSSLFNQRFTLVQQIGATRLYRVAN